MFAESTEVCYRNDAGICRFNLLSCCTKGRKCFFLHDMLMEPYNIDTEAPAREDPCYFFMKGKCIDGESCRRSHSELPCFNGTVKKVCSYFSRGRCRRGKLCRYIHDPSYNNSPGDICAVSHPSSSFQLDNDNVSPVIINPSDDVQSMVVKPKLCRFYPRGMCFFGDRCTNFHDKPEKDSDNFISNLRENEALSERSEFERVSPGVNANVLPVEITKNKETDVDIPKVASLSSNRKKHHKKTRRVTHNYLKSEEFLPFSYNDSKISESRVLRKGVTNVGESTELSYTPLKSVEEINPSSSSKLIMQTNPCSSSNSTRQTNQRSYSKSIKPTSPCSSSKPNEFSKVANNSSNLKKFARVKTYRPSCSKHFSEESRPKEFEYGRNISTKSKEFEYSSKSIEFVRGSCCTNSKEFITNSCIPSKPKGSSRSNYTYGYFKSKNISKSKNNFEAQSNSKLNQKVSTLRGTENLISEELPADVCLESKEFTRNKLTEQLRNKNNSEPVNSLEHSKITDDLRMNKESLTRTFSDVTSSHNLKLVNVRMTRKQSKSQRKPKSENMQSRIFFKKMFFKTPVTVKHVTKKL